MILARKESFTLTERDSTQKDPIFARSS